MNPNPSTANLVEQPPSRQASAGASRGARFAERVALCGFALYAVFAPHSIAGAEISLALVGLGWIARLIITRRTGIRRSALDIPILLFLGWTILSSIFSAEPRISLPKLQSTAVVLLFYLTQSFLTRRAALWLAVLMIVSGVAGVGESILDLARGRGAMISELTSESPFHELQMGAGDSVWRVNSRRIRSIEELDEAIRRAPTGTRLPVSIIKKGEHGDRPGFIVTEEMKARPSPSGLKSTGPTHRFRASGWTRHYETFSETLQILAQLSLGLALAGLKRGQKSRRKFIYLLLVMTGMLVLGIALAAMRTTFVALGFGASMIALRATRGRTRLLITTMIVIVLGAGALSIWHTRTVGALMLEDHSASLRWQVARVGLSRITARPLFGHGMDAVKNHWTEWGFPGTDMIHLHSTPLQIAFDRGLPALLLWLWVMWTCWRLSARGEKLFREGRDDAGTHGLLLGATGAVAGFFASSLVNYNFGDAEVVLVFWWLMGIVVSLQSSVFSFQLKQKAED